MLGRSKGEHGLVTTGERFVGIARGRGALAVLAAAIALGLVLCAPARARAAAAVVPESATGQGTWTTIVRHVPSNLSPVAPSEAAPDFIGHSAAPSRIGRSDINRSGINRSGINRSGISQSGISQSGISQSGVQFDPQSDFEAGAKSAVTPPAPAAPILAAARGGANGDWLNIDGIEYQRRSLAASSAPSGAAGIPWQGVAWILAGALVLSWRWWRRHRRRQLAAAASKVAANRDATDGASAAMMTATIVPEAPPDVGSEAPPAPTPAAIAEAATDAAPAPAEVVPAAAIETPASAVVDALASSAAAPEPVSAPVTKVAAMAAPAAPSAEIPASEMPVPEPSPLPSPVAEAAKPAPAQRTIRVRILTAADAEGGGANVAVESSAAKRLAEARAMLLLRGVIPMAEIGDAARTPANSSERRAASKRPMVTVQLEPVRPPPARSATPPLASSAAPSAIPGAGLSEAEKRTLLRLV